MNKLPSLKTIFALLFAVCMTGCTPSKNNKANEKTDSSSKTFSLKRLASLTNYRSVLVSGLGNPKMTIKTSVHSPSNWQVNTGLTIRHIKNKSYTKIGDSWSEEAEKTDAYSKHNLPSFARQFYGMTQVSHAKITRGKAVRQADKACHIWTISANGGATLRETFTAYIADKSGALLKLIVGADGTATGEKHASEIYTILSIGDVDAFAVPGPLSDD